MGRTNIEWTEMSWSPVTGCTKISTGCRNCYAERMAKRLAGRYGYPEQPNHFDVTLHMDKLKEPLKWKKPRMIFVCSMGDIFHEDVDPSYITDIFDVMEMAKQHIFQVLTKRPQRMLDVLYGETGRWHFGGGDFLSNVWLGVTVENQQAADWRIPYLLQTTGFLHFVSVEPMLSPVDLSLFQPFVRHHAVDFMRARGILGGTIDWVICGGETGPGAREMKTAWAFDLYQQCQDAGVPFFFKKAGDAFQGDPAELPTAREFPDAS